MNAPAALAPEQILRRWLLPLGVLALAAPVRLWAALRDQGLFWPDEIYQSLEQAHRLAFGNGLVPWEFQQGARSWLFPGLLGALFKAAALCGARDALTFVVLAKLAVVALGLVGVVAAMRLAQRLAGPSGALLAGSLCAFFPAMVVYGARCMTETVSGPLLVAAALLVLEPGVRRARLAAALAGVAVFLRYQNGLVAAGLLVLLLAQKRRADAMAYLQVAVAVGLAGGALDWATWGTPFKSFIEYVKFNVVEGKSKQWGVSAFYFYAAAAWTSTGPLLLLVLLGLALSVARARGLALLTAAFVLAHCLIPHKEYRFLMPILPLALALAGAGLARGFHALQLPRWPVVGLALAFGLVGLPQALAETFAQMGQYTDSAGGQRSVWHADEDVNLCLLDASRREDLCGLAVVGIHPAWMGGYTYLHRDVPIYFRVGAEERQRANYVAAPAGARLPDFTEVARHESFALYRREGACAPRPPGWMPLLP